MKTTTRWRISPAAWPAIAIAFLAEAAANALRAYGLGEHLTQFTLDLYSYPVSLAGAVMVLAALAVSLTQTRAAWVALTPGDTRQRILAGLMAALLLSISVTAMAAHVLAAMRTAGSDETHDQGAYDRTETAYKAARSNYEAVKGAQTIDAVQAQITALHIDANIYRRTKECDPAEAMKKSVWQDECRPLANLQRPLADARRKAELEGTIADLKAKLDAMKRPDKESEAEHWVNKAWGWMIALGIVFIATAGPALFAKVELVEHGPEIQESVTSAPAEKPEPAKPNPTPPRNSGKRGRKARSNVTQFSDAFRARHGRAPSGKEIKAEFPELPKTTAYDYSKRSRA